MIYVIADLHLSFGSDKPMDIFGSRWDNHPEILKKNWEKTVKPEDTIILPGDISWGMTPVEALPDLRFLDGLPGRKILMRGNHDYWWQTEKKLKDFFLENGIITLETLNNRALLIEDMAICGGKGYLPDAKMDAAQNEKLLARERLRLEMALKCARKQTAAGSREASPVVFLHYPPLLRGYTTEMLPLLHEYGVKDCYFGHLHAAGHHSAVTGEFMGINFHLVAADYINFEPVLVN